MIRYFYGRAFIACAFPLLAMSSPIMAAKTFESFHELTKVTVGPYDNFQSSVDENETVLYYTRSQNLSTQIMRLDLKTGMSSPVTAVEADAKSPAISPNGKTLAFTYFRNDAKGDICLLEDKTVRCITGRGRGEDSPFWVGNDKIGYASTDDVGNNSKIFIHDLKSKTDTLIIEGAIYSPSVSADGKRLVYNGQNHHLVLLEITDPKSTAKLSITLPGTTGAAKFSKDGQYLYFAQYMLDTNRDQKLDSRDGAAIFRIKASAPDQVPEQMTSLTQDCAYPTPMSGSLYVSCAFEGALDIYRLRLTGIVPEHWKAKDLWEAHQAARSYSDRILTLNHLFGRFKELDAANADERTMNDLILMQAWLPAVFYAEKIANKEPKFQAHKILLEAMVRWESLPSKEQVAELNQMIREEAERLSKIPDSPLKRLVNAYLDYFANKNAVALKKANAVSSNDPMTLYWQTRLFQMLLGTERGRAYERVLEQRIILGDLTEETRLFYLSRWLERLPEGSKAHEVIRDLRGALNPKDPVSARMVELLDNEEQLLRVIQATTKEQSRNEMRGIVDRVKRLKDHYYAMRLVFARALTAFYKGDKTRELSSVMSLWLSYVKPDSKEFPYVIEALRRNSLDVAYKFFNGPAATRDLAIGAFNDSLRTTDDLESHYQFALLQTSEAAWKELEKSYTAMIRDGLIAKESLSFVRVIRDVLMSKDPVSDSKLASALSTVEAIDDQHVGSGVKYLLIGYLNHRRLLLNKDAFKVDRDQAERAHRGYIFAIDAAWFNERIKAAAYQNLGLLHAHLRNYSLAADFLQKRHELGFMSNKQRQAVYWIEASALFRSYRAIDAMKVTEAALDLNPNPREPFLERLAFYAWNAREFEAATSAYEDVLPRLGDQATSGIYLGYGFALMKMGRTLDAEKAFNRAIDLSKKEKIKERDGLAADPLKNQFVALGLLARLELPQDRRVSYLTRRLKAFDDALADPKKWFLDRRALESQRAKEAFDLVMLRVNAGDRAGSTKEAEKAIMLAAEFGKSHGYLNQTVFVSSKNSMLLARDGKIDNTKPVAEAIQTMVRGVESSLKNDKTPPVSGRQAWAEIKMIEGSYLGGKGLCGGANFVGFTNVFDSDFVKSLEVDSPGSVAALKKYQDGVIASCR